MQILHIAQIVSDDRSGIAAGVEHLVKLGHTRIAFSSHEGESKFALSRKLAFKETMVKHGLSPKNPTSPARAGRYLKHQIHQ